MEKEEGMLGQGRDGGWMTEERWLWTTAFPAPSRGRLGKQEWRGKSIKLHARGQKKNSHSKGIFLLLHVFTRRSQ